MDVNKCSIKFSMKNNNSDKNQYNSLVHKYPFFSLSIRNPDHFVNDKMTKTIVTNNYHI